MSEQDLTEERRAELARIEGAKDDVEARCHIVRRQAEDEVRKRCGSGDLRVPPLPAPLERDPQPTAEQLEAFADATRAHNEAVEAHVNKLAPGLAVERRQAFAASGNPRRRAIAMRLAGEPLEKCARVFLGDEPAQAAPIEEEARPAPDPSPLPLGDDED